MTNAQQQLDDMQAYIAADFLPEQVAVIDKYAAKFRALFVADPLAAVASALVAAEIIARDTADDAGGEGG